MFMQIEDIVKKLKTKKSKNIIYLLIFVVFGGWFAYRFYTVAHERNTDVFNIIRNDAEYGTPVEIMQIHETYGILYEPVTIKNNKAYVSSARVKMFRANQQVGNCKITSVSKNLDLYTGMYVIKTSKCDDGLQYAQIQGHGFFVPVSAMHGNVVYVVNSGVARMKEVKISGRDLQNVLIISGLQDGDKIILSNVKDNQKIKIVK